MATSQSYRKAALTRRAGGGFAITGAVGPAELSEGGADFDVFLLLVDEGGNPLETSVCFFSMSEKCYDPQISENNEKKP